jgi:hypothetical protein
MYDLNKDKVIKKLIIKCVTNGYVKSFGLLLKLSKRTNKDPNFYDELISLIVSNKLSGRIASKTIKDIAEGFLTIFPDKVDYLFTLAVEKRRVDILLAIPKDYLPSYDSISEAISYSNYRSNNEKLIDHLVRIGSNIENFLVLAIEEDNYHIVDAILKSGIYEDAADPEALIVLAINNRSLNSLPVIISRYSDYLSDEIIIAAGKKSSTMFKVIIDSLPKNYLFTRLVLDKLGKPSLNVITRKLGIRPQTKRQTDIRNIIAAQEKGKRVKEESKRKINFARMGKARAGRSSDSGSEESSSSDSGSEESSSSDPGSEESSSSDSGSEKSRSSDSGSEESSSESGRSKRTVRSSDSGSEESSSTEFSDIETETSSRSSEDSQNSNDDEDQP